MRNGHKWAVMVAIGFLGGAVSAASDPGASLRDYLRHGLIALAPTLTALNVTLEKQQESSNAAGGGA